MCCLPHQLYDTVRPRLPPRAPFTIIPPLPYHVLTMGMTLTEKIIKAHLATGEMLSGREIGIRIDQTLTQDATGTMAYLEFEAIGIPRVRTELSVSYVDHNMLQSDYRNMDDHRFLQSAAKKYGAYFSKPGNGILPPSAPRALWKAGEDPSRVRFSYPDGRGPRHARHWRWRPWMLRWRWGARAFLYSHA